MGPKIGYSMILEKSFLRDLKHKNESYSKEYKENDDEDEFELVLNIFRLASAFSNHFATFVKNLEFE